MPLYEYECTQCERRHELRQRWGDEPLASCPRCGAPVRRVYSPAAIIYKGSGFYSTDYGRTSGASSR